MNTRFNPTTNGDLHLGHAYMAILNERIASNSGGSFLLRFDDNSRPFMARHGVVGMSKMAELQRRDLHWLGIIPDDIQFQSDEEEKVKTFLAQSRFQMVIDHVYDGMCENRPVIISNPPIRAQRVSTWVVAERVVLDRWWGVDMVVRGLDLIQSHGLYMYFCALFGFRFPRWVYLQRLVTSDGKDVSKTMGNWTLRTLRDAGVSADKVWELLRESCLANPAGKWAIDNVKSAPRLVIDYPGELA